VNDYHERDAGVVGYVVEELPEGSEPTGGSANADYHRYRFCRWIGWHHKSPSTGLAEIKPVAHLIKLS
jgi:hypothetical protein